MRPVPEFWTTITYDGARDVCVVAVQGDVDPATAPALKAMVIQASQDHQCPVVVDAQEVGFIDAAGIGALIGASTVVRDLGRRVTVRNPSPSVHKLLRLTGLDDSPMIERSIPTGQSAALR